MNIWVRRSIQAMILTGGFVVLGATAAQAHELAATDTPSVQSVVRSVSQIAPVNLPAAHKPAAVTRSHGGGGATATGVTSGAHSILGGNQIQAPVNAPVNITHNAVAAGGFAAAPGGRAAKTQMAAGGGGGATATGVTDGTGSIGGGNQVQAPVNAPVTVCGNAIAVIGKAIAGCDTGSGGAGSATAKGTTSGAHSIVGGNQVQAPVNAPVTVCGNAIAAVGGALAGCEVHGGSGSGGAIADAKSDGTGSIGGGNQVQAPLPVPLPVNAPSTTCGNAVGALGKAAAGCKVSGSGNGSAVAKAQTSGKDSVVGGNQVQAPVNAPVTVCGNAIGNALAGCKTGGGSGAGAVANGKTDGTHSVVGGNQVQVPVNAPVTVCGNAGAALGKALAGCKVGGGNGGATATGDTSGTGSVGGGNQAQAPVNAPVTVCGNAVAAIGKAIAGCLTGKGSGSGSGPALMATSSTTSSVPGVAAGVVALLALVGSGLTTSVVRRFKRA
ncbi:chaplin [Fodinicola acaciae]|uniref:chaplin n=1 Tax=Fodinicola acaciae TaxID=2681555 RepID=UPI0013D44128|nr:chaplin [Fodinicola acaciae]